MKNKECEREKKKVVRSSTFGEVDGDVLPRDPGWKKKIQGQKSSVFFLVGPRTLKTLLELAWPLS